jgi:hypothetical protein
MYFKVKSWEEIKINKGPKWLAGKRYEITFSIKEP